MITEQHKIESERINNIKVEEEKPEPFIGKMIQLNGMTLYLSNENKLVANPYDVEEREVNFKEEKEPVELKSNETLYSEVM